MADAPKPVDSAEKAYAEAAAEAKPAKIVEPAAIAPKAPASRMKIAKAAPKKAAAKTRAAKAAKKPASAPALASPTVKELKEKIMATAKTTTDFTQPISEAFGEFQSRAKVAYDKGTEAVTEATEFAKGNVEAFVESGKILSNGVQALGKSYVEEAKSAYETLTGDLKEIAAVKSPTELFQLQGKIMRRNFDLFVTHGSKNTDAVLKLANDAFAPITGRVSIAAEKLGKVA